MKVGDLIGGEADEASLTPQQRHKRARDLKKVRDKIMKWVTLKLKSDIDAYMESNEEKIIFTVANGGGFSIGIEAYIPDNRSIEDAMADSGADVDTLELQSTTTEDAAAAELRESVIRAAMREMGEGAE